MSMKIRGRYVRFYIVKNPQDVEIFGKCEVRNKEHFKMNHY